MAVLIWALVFNQLNLFLPWHAQFHYKFSETVASICAVGLKDGKVFPLFNWGDKLVTAAAAGVCLGSSTATTSGGHTSVHLIQMCTQPEQNLTLSMCSMLFALDLYFYECGLFPASSRFTALPYQNLPGLGLLFRLTGGTARGTLNVEHKNLQQPTGTVTWRCISILGKVFSQCRDRGWGTALFGHPEVWYQSLQSDTWPRQRLSCLVLHLWLGIHSV